MKQIRKPEVFVLLMGGLGNQLFQASAGMYFGSSTVYLVSNLANATKNRNGQPEIFDFALPEKLKEYSFEDIGLLTQKLINYSIRLSTHRRSIRHLVIEKLLSYAISKNLKRKLSVRISDNVGYSQSILISKESVLLIGYFQSWIYAETLINSCNNHKLELKTTTRNFLDSMILIPRTNWRLVHVRLGDYLTNGDFGLLSPMYFIKQIELQNRDQSMPTLVFTNDKHKLKKLYPSLSEHTSESDENLSSAELLKLCSFASNFVISNSTFSWWAAYISGHGGINVIAPEPWFRYANSPTELMPPHWSRSMSNYLELK
jgi:hypothetical protein